MTPTKEPALKWHCFICQPNPGRNYTSGMCRLHELETYEKNNMLEGYERIELSALRDKNFLSAAIDLVVWVLMSASIIYLIWHFFRWQESGYRIIG